MPDRARQIAQFLSRAGWGAAARAHLAGDASTRGYERLCHPDGRSAVLMDAPPEGGHDVGLFCRIGNYLAQAGLSAPQVLAQAPDRGLLLLEDFGDAVFARVMVSAPQQEAELYAAAAEMLLRLQALPPPQDLAPLDAPRLAEMIAPFCDFYAEEKAAPAALAELPMALAEVLSATVTGPAVFCLRDCHAENLIWLADRAGVRRVGLLDFQDAALAHPAYDLVSLLQDARRDVPEDVQKLTIDRLLAVSSSEREPFLAAYAALGLQRNLRILGVFARLAVVEGKMRYLSLMPRVWGHVRRNLRHPALHPLRAPLDVLMPEPTTDVLARFRPHVPA